jgi:hypothetical protein
MASMPLAWFCAQDSASTLLRASGSPWPQASFEYHAIHDVLSLTSLFTGLISLEAKESRRSLSYQRRMVEDDVGWAVWCEYRLAFTVDGITRADMHSAHRAWRWLKNSQLLAGTLHEIHHWPMVPVKRPAAGLSIGVAYARLLIDNKIALL